MNEQKAPNRNPGDVYLTAEEQAALMTKIMPSVYDPTPVRNKVLDIQYGTLPEQKLDLYLPEEGDGPFPVIFDVHGGGWMLGSKREGFVEHKIAALEKGYAVIAPDYRLFPGAIFPENLYDVKTAVRWARAHASEYHLDPDHFFMVGDSAGAHLTLMMAFTADRPEYAGYQYGWPEYSDAIQAACDMFGPTVLDDRCRNFYSESGVKRAVFGEGGLLLEDIIGMVFGTNDNLLKLISPLELVHRDIPPVLILQGREDSIVAWQHSQLLYDRICACCGEGHSELHIYEGYNHEDAGFYEDGKLCAMLVEFFGRGV